MTYDCCRLAQKFHKTNAQDFYDENLSTLQITVNKVIFAQLFSKTVNQLIARLVMCGRLIIM